MTGLIFISARLPEQLWPLVSVVRVGKTIEITEKTFVYHQASLGTRATTILVVVSIFDGKKRSLCDRKMSLQQFLQSQAKIRN